MFRVSSLENTTCFLHKPLVDLYSRLCFYRKQFKKYSLLVRIIAVFDLLVILRFYFFIIISLHLKPKYIHIITHTQYNQIVVKMALFHRLFLLFAIFFHNNYGTTASLKEAAKFLPIVHYQLFTECCIRPHFMMQGEKECDFYF